MIRLWKRFYNVNRPHSSLGKNVTPEEFYKAWTNENEKKDGCAGGGGIGLSLCSLPACGENSRPAPATEDRPTSRQAIHVGARLLRSRAVSSAWTMQM